MSDKKGNDEVAELQSQLAKAREEIAAKEAALEVERADRVAIESQRDVALANVATEHAARTATEGQRDQVQHELEVRQEQLEASVQREQQQAARADGAEQRAVQFEHALNDAAEREHNATKAASAAIVLERVRVQHLQKKATDAEAELKTAREQLETANTELTAAHVEVDQWRNAWRGAAWDAFKTAAANAGLKKQLAAETARADANAKSTVAGPSVAPSSAASWAPFSTRPRRRSSSHPTDVAAGCDAVSSVVRRLDADRAAP